MNTPKKPKRRILWCSTLISFVAAWVVPLYPVNNSWQPLYSRSAEIFHRLAEGYFFAAAGYCVEAMLFAAVIFLISVTLGWLVEPLLLFVRSRTKKDDHGI